MRHILLLVKLIFLLAIVFQPAAGLCQAVKPQIVSPILNGGLPVVPVEFQGKQYSFILDSGASIHCFDTSLQPLLGPPIRPAIGKSSTGKVAATLFKLPRATVCDLNIGSKVDFVASIDLAELRRATGVNIQGVVGVPFFLEQVLSLNLAQDLLIIAPAGDPKRFGERFAVSFDQLRRPTVIACPLGGRETHFLIDTGSTLEISLNTTMFENVGNKRLIQMYADGFVAGVAGNRRLRNGRLNAFTLGSFKHSNLLVEDGSSNSLGTDYLTRFIVTFDLANQSIYMNPSADYQRLWHPNLSGIHVLVVDGQIVVQHVDENSPAFKAGVTKGDIITYANTRAMTGEMVQWLRQLFRSDPKQKIILSMRRMDKEISVTFELREQPWEYE